MSSGLKVNKYASEIIEAVQMNRYNVKEVYNWVKQFCDVQLIRDNKGYLLIINNKKNKVDVRMNDYIIKSTDENQLHSFENLNEEAFQKIYTKIH